MLHFNRKTDSGNPVNLSLTLTFEQRSKSRLRAELDDGSAAAVTLERGTQLFPGDVLASEEGELVRIVAAVEQVSVVRCQNAHLLARASYHLGNRHVALQIDPAELRYLHDHVLDDMLKLLGLEVEVKSTSFEPESGAYGEHAHIHGHQH